MIVKSFKQLVSVLFVCLSLTTTLYAAEPAPLQILRTASNQMLAELSQQQPQLKSNPQLVFNMVSRILLPKIDVTVMARSVVGRQYWQTATPAQRTAFKKEFTTLMLKTYAAPLTEFKRDTIRFLPMRGYQSDRPRVQVQSQIVRQNGQVIPVNYRLVKRGDTWKVYDFSVEGISIIQSYRSQFASILSTKGFQALIDQLKTHNRRA